MLTEKKKTASITKQGKFIILFSFKEGNILFWFNFFLLLQI